MLNHMSIVWPYKTNPKRSKAKLVPKTVSGVRCCSMYLKASTSCWFLDSECSNHMTDIIFNFKSLTEIDKGNVTFRSKQKHKICKERKVSSQNLLFILMMYYMLWFKSIICSA